MNNQINYKNKGLSGLINLGNTCFINSIFQILSHTYELNDLLIDGEIIKKINTNKLDSVIFIEWNNLRKKLWSKNGVINPLNMINSIRKISRIKKTNIFVEYQQNDITEFLVFLLSSFHSAVSRKVDISISGIPNNEEDNIAVKVYEYIKKTYSNEYSEIWNLFFAVSVSVMINKETNELIKYIPESFSILSLPIPKQSIKSVANNGAIEYNNISIYDCFDTHIEKETFDGIEADNNPNIKQTVTKHIEFWSFPNILIIDLKRYNSIGIKNDTYVDFPIEGLDLSKYVIGYNKHSYIYDLYGICNHIGNSVNGHYFSYIKNYDNWYEMNDDIVTKIIDYEENIVTNNAYCLFYRKRKQ